MVRTEKWNAGNSGSIFAILPPVNGQKLKAKTKEWLRRYVPAEILGTICSLAAAWVAYSHTHSFIAAAASGWVGEGFGFYGYFITAELLLNAKRYSEHPFIKRVSLAAVTSSTNLIVEFVPAEVLDNFFIRPLAMYSFPQFIHPYPLGFLVGKFSADAIFYLLAIVGFEARKRWLHWPRKPL